MNMCGLVHNEIQYDTACPLVALPTTGCRGMLWGIAACVVEPYAHLAWRCH